jgi:hypothetical protein
MGRKQSTEQNIGVQNHAHQGRRAHSSASSTASSIVVGDVAAFCSFARIASNANSAEAVATPNAAERVFRVRSAGAGCFGRTSMFMIPFYHGLAA